MYIKLELEAIFNYLVYNCNNIVDSVLIFDFIVRFNY